MFLQTKTGEGQLITYIIRYGNKKHQALIFDTKMNFYIVVVHDIANDISDEANLNRFNKLQFFG